MISPAEIRRIAALAALDVNEDELKILSSQLSRVLEHCDRAARPGRDAGGMSPGPAMTPERDDDVSPADPPIDISGLAPPGTVSQGLFSAPRVVDTG